MDSLNTNHSWVEDMLLQDYRRMNYGVGDEIGINFTLMDNLYFKLGYGEQELMMRISLQPELTIAG